ncbi:hypothetical protein BC829DRAFT_383152 [Chytridium lagenaria]|nr:hypothetical protein BC829DRAFT_383152 [Chytridium lagenaria]
MPVRRIFVDDEGNPLKFVVVRYEGWSEIRKAIEKYGGQVIHTQQRKMAFMSIVQTDCASDFIAPDSYSSKFVWDCIEAGRLLEPSKYLINIDGLPSGRKKSRTMFTAEDDRILIRWLANLDPKQAKLGGNAAYEELSKKYKHHSAQSWRSRFTKELEPTKLLERYRELGEDALKSVGSAKDTRNEKDMEESTEQGSSKDVQSSGAVENEKKAPSPRRSGRNKAEGNAIRGTSSQVERPRPSSPDIEVLPKNTRRRAVPAAEGPKLPLVVEDSEDERVFPSNQAQRRVDILRDNPNQSNIGRKVDPEALRGMKGGSIESTTHIAKKQRIEEADEIGSDVLGANDIDLGKGESARDIIREMESRLIAETGCSEEDVERALQMTCMLEKNARELLRAGFDLTKLDEGLRRKLTELKGDSAISFREQFLDLPI